MNYFITRPALSPCKMALSYLIMLKQIETLGQAYNNIYAQWESIGLFSTGFLLGLWAVWSYRKRGTFILKIPRLIIGSKIEKTHARLLFIVHVFYIIFFFGLFFLLS